VARAKVKYNIEIVVIEVVMKQESKRRKITALSLAALFILFSLFNTLFKEKFGIRALSPDLESLNSLKKFLIFISAYSFVCVIVFQIWRDKVFIQLSKRNNAVRSENLFLLFNYLLLVSPTIFGQVLYFAGMPLREFFYFIGVSFIAVLIWAIFDFQKQ